MNAQHKVRVGAVSYLNTRPLIYQFERLAPTAELILDLPSRLADGLAEGVYDVALIPSVEFFQDTRFQLVSDACIGCRGPVLSVKLFFRRPPQQVRTLALDEGSRTSVALTRILLAEQHGIHPQVEILPIGAGLEDTTADAVLLIGDRAIHSPLGQFVEVWDLGDQWRRWSGLPFVFAVWAARPGTELGQIPQALAAARDAGVQALEQIAATEAPAFGLTQPECLSYLRDNLYFFLGPRERQGLEQFRQLALRHGLLQKGLLQKGLLQTGLVHPAPAPV